MCSIISLLSLLPFTLSAALPAQNGSVACNNSPALCSRSYSNITQLGAHDSPFLRDASTDNSQSGNQYVWQPQVRQHQLTDYRLVNTTSQLNAGVRLVTAQVHNNTGSLHLCHTSCDLLDAGRLSTWLKEIKTWMDTNLNEVVTILLVNSDSSSAAQLHQEFVTAGIDKYGFVPPQNNQALQTWPTLQSLIAANTRLITFIADLDPSTTKAAGAPYLLNEFTFVFENPFQVTSANNFSCIPDRPSAVAGNIEEAISSSRLSLVNHFLDIEEAFGITVPDVANAELTNANSGVVGNLGTAAADCAQKFGKQPNYLLVDFFDQGSAIDTVDKINGITPIGRTQPGSLPDAQTILGSNAAMKGTIINDLIGSPLGALVLVGIGLQIVMVSL